MKDKRNIPDRREFLTDEAYRLRQAEVATGQHLKRRKALVGAIVTALLTLGLGLVWFLVNR